LVVGVERRQECRPFQNDTYPHMTMAMDAAFMTFGKPEETLQVLIVAGEIRIIAADKQARGEGIHGLGHGLSYGEATAVQFFREGLE